MGTDESEAERWHMSDWILGEHLLDQERRVAEVLEAGSIRVLGRIKGSNQFGPLDQNELARVVRQQSGSVSLKIRQFLFQLRHGTPQSHLTRGR